MSSDEFGFGPCRADTDRGWSCTEAAVDDSGMCRWHMKVACRMTRRLAQEPLAAPAPRKKKVQP